MVQLYCLPVPCRCGRHDGYASAYGYVHASSEECPFASMHNEPPQDVPCCALFIEPARKNLIALDQDALASDMEDDLSCEHAVQLGLRLRAWIALERASYAGYCEKPHGRVTGVSADENGIRPIDRATFEQALASILVASCWYDEVGHRGYGVKTVWR